MVNKAANKNIFQIWRDIGEKTPFIVRRWTWDERYTAMITDVSITKWPYGTAYGYAMTNGLETDFFKYDKAWCEHGLVPNAGSYQWELVGNGPVFGVRSIP